MVWKKNLDERFKNGNRQKKMNSVYLCVCVKNLMEEEKKCWWRIDKNENENDDKIIILEIGFEREKNFVETWIHWKMLLAQSVRGMQFVSREMRLLLKRINTQRLFSFFFLLWKMIMMMNQRVERHKILKRMGFQGRRERELHTSQPFNSNNKDRLFWTNSSLIMTQNRMEKMGKIQDELGVKIARW